MKAMFVPAKLQMVKKRGGVKKTTSRIMKEVAQVMKGEFALLSSAQSPGSVGFALGKSGRQKNPQTVLSSACGGCNERSILDTLSS